MARKKKAEAKAPEKAVPAPKPYGQSPKPETQQPKHETTRASPASFPGAPLPRTGNPKPASPVPALPKNEPQQSLKAPEPQRLLAAPPMNLPPPVPQDAHAALKAAATIIMLALAVAAGAWFLLMQQEQGVPVPGARVNGATFADLLAKAGKVYIIMDVRGAADDAVRQNVLQCGVDFAGSPGLASKEITAYSFENKTVCQAMEGTLTVSQCLKATSDGTTLYVHGGDGNASFYTNMMDVTIGRNYSANGCRVNVKKAQ